MTISKPFAFPERFDPGSKHGSLLLADCIRDFWSRRGYRVRTERFEVREGRWGVVSDLVNGLPAELVGKRR